MNDFTDHLAAQFPEAHFRSGLLVFFDANVALEIVDHVEAANLAILGIDGFMINELRVYPSLDRVADFSRLHGPDNATFVSRSCDAARALLQGDWAEPPTAHPAGQMRPGGEGGRHMIEFTLKEPTKPHK